MNRFTKRLLTGLFCVSLSAIACGGVDPADESTAESNEELRWGWTGSSQSDAQNGTGGGYVVFCNPYGANYCPAARPICKQWGTSGIGQCAIR